MSEQPFTEEQQVAVAKVVARVLINCGHLRHAKGDPESPWAIGPSLLVAKAVLSMGVSPGPPGSIGENGREGVQPLSSDEGWLVVHTPLSSREPRYLMGATPKVPSAARDRA